MKKMKVWFIPNWSKSVPYQALLERALASLNVAVEYPGWQFLWRALTHGRPDVLHVHWLDPFCLAPGLTRSLFRTAKYFTQVIMLKLIGVRIIWTVHNLQNHERLRLGLDRACSGFMAALADGIIVHCPSARESIIHEYRIRKPEKVRIIEQGHYLGIYAKNDARDLRRELALAPGQTVFLFLGMLRPYKGVNELIDAFAALNKSSASLLIAGKPLNEAADRDLRQRIGAHPNIIYRPGFVPDSDVDAYYQACDAAVFPYRDVLTSAGTQLSLSLGRPCIAPRLGCIRETVDETCAFLYDPADEQALTQALRLALHAKDKLPTMGAQGLARAKGWDWREIAQKTKDLYCQMIGGQNY